MCRTVALAGILALALGPSASNSPAQARRVTLEAADCSRHNMMFGDVQVARAGRASACGSGNRDWDDRTRSLRLGADPVVVRLSTVNGPVTVSER